MSASDDDQTIEMTRNEQARADAPLLGEVVDGRYAVKGVLGQGGMGAVYRAEHLTLRKDVALKVIHADFAGDGDLRARFAREAMASAQVDHPHVASALDFGSLPTGEAYLVMELAAGPSLGDVMDEGPMAWPRVLSIGGQVADALAAAHAKGIVHRDLKPDNVMLVVDESGTERVKVLDFGIARVPDDAQRSPIGAAPGRPLTRQGIVMGTPGYMSPEQALGEPVDHRTDLYALGVLLWEGLTGRALFDAPLTEIITRQTAGLIPPLGDEEMLDAPPAELETLIRELLAPAVADRPESAHIVRDRLVDLAMRASFEGEGPASGLTPLALPRVATGVAVMPTAPVVRHSALGRWIFAAVLLLVLAAGGALALRGELPIPGLTEPAFEGQAMPTQVAQDFGALLAYASRAHRIEAAERIVAFQPAEQVPAHVRATADLQLAVGCVAKREALARVVAAQNPDVLPYLNGVAATRRRGCGRNGHRDCIACLREDLDAAIASLSGLASTAAPPPAAPAD